MVERANNIFMPSWKLFWLHEYTEKRLGSCRDCGTTRREPLNIFYVQWHLSFVFVWNMAVTKKVMTAVAGSWWKAGIIFLFFKKNSSEVIKSSLGGCTSCEVCSPAIPWMLIRGVGSQVVAALQRVPPMYSAFLWLVIDFENCYLSLSFNCELFWVW